MAKKTIENTNEESELIQQAMRTLGQRTSERKANSSRENGKLGGKPPGKPMSDETKEKIRDAQRKRHATRKEANQK